MVECLEYYVYIKIILKSKYCIYFVLSSFETKITLTKPALKICDHTAHHDSTMTIAGLVHT
jgi:hypothetical protein